MTDTPTTPRPRDAAFVSTINVHLGTDPLPIEAHLHDDGVSGWVYVADHRIAIHGTLDQLIELAVGVAAAITDLRADAAQAAKADVA